MPERLNPHLELPGGIRVVAWKGYLAAAEAEAVRASLAADRARVLAGLGWPDDLPDATAFLYPDEASKAAGSGEDGLGHAVPERMEMHAVHNAAGSAASAHELVHLLTWPRLGLSNLAMAEGLAESFEEGWRGSGEEAGERLPHDAWVRRFLADGRYVPVADLFDDGAFWELDPTGAVSYPECGSFVAFLRRRHGTGAVLACMAALGRRAPLGENLAAFRDTLGESVEEAEEAWLGELAEGPAGPAAPDPAR